MRKVLSRLFVLFKSSTDLGKPSENKEGSQHDSPASDVNLQKRLSDTSYLGNSYPIQSETKS